MLIEYRRGMLEKGVTPESLPVNVWHGTEVPTDVKKAVNEEATSHRGPDD